MIKAVIFDCFGVLVVEAWVPLRDELFGHDATLVQDANDHMKRLSLGHSTVAEFAEVIGKMGGVLPVEVIDRMHRNPINESLFTFITSLKPNYKLGILSNVGANRIVELLGEENMKLFDVIGLSFDMGVAKPDARAYTMVADWLAVSPDECVFTDDIERYVVAAVDVGMKGIIFTDTKQFITEFEEITK